MSTRILALAGLLACTTTAAQAQQLLNPFTWFDPGYYGAPSYGCPNGNCGPNAGYRGSPYANCPNGNCNVASGYRGMPSNACPGGVCPVNAGYRGLPNANCPNGNCPVPNYGAAYRSQPLPTNYAPANYGPANYGPMNYGPADNYGPYGNFKNVEPTYGNYKPLPKANFDDDYPTNRAPNLNRAASTPTRNFQANDPFYR